MVIFHHIYQINNWEKIVEEQRDLINRIPHTGYFPCYNKENDVGFELPTLLKLWEYCNQTKKNEIVCYIHTKGVSTPNAKNRRLWRETLNYWVLRRWQDNLVLLKKFDTSGARRFTFKHGGFELPHYSGNFWWANSDYVRSLPDPDSYSKKFEPTYSPDGTDPKRFACEFWIGSGKGKMGVVDNYPIKRFRQITGFKGLMSYEKLEKKFG